jgi:hypothetical protein
MTQGTPAFGEKYAKFIEFGKAVDLYSKAWRGMTET